MFSSLTKIINAKYLLTIRHVVRIFINSVNMLIGFLIISFACTFHEYEVSFWISLLSSIILGVVSALGESTTLGFCKGFPSTIVGNFSSGTGFAGVFGSGIILVLKGAGLNNGQIFFIITPTVIPYFIAFWWINRTKEKYPYIPEDKNASSISVLSEDAETTNNDRNNYNLVNGTPSDNMT